MQQPTPQFSPLEAAVVESGALSPITPHTGRSEAYAVKRDANELSDSDSSLSSYKRSPSASPSPSRSRTSERLSGRAERHSQSRDRKQAERAGTLFMSVRIYRYVGMANY